MKPPDLLEKILIFLKFQELQKNKGRLECDLTSTSLLQILTYDKLNLA